MAEYLSTINHLSKADTSPEAYAQETYSTQVSPEVDIANNDKLLRLDCLNSLSEEKIVSLLQLKEDAIRETTRGFAEKTIQPGLYIEGGGKYFVFPDSLIVEDSMTAGLVYDLCSLAHINLKTVRYEASFTQVIDEKFIEGLWFGIFSSVHLKRRKAKLSYELGRTCSYSLIVRNMFKNTEELGMNALVRDNFFFGNNPGEIENKRSVSYYIKTRLKSFYSEPIIGDLIYTLINYCADFIGFSNLKESEADIAIADSICPIDSVIASCYPTITKKIGKNSVSQKRKPKNLRASPLFTKEEMSLITKYTTSVFSELEIFQKDYINAVFTNSFDKVRTLIKENINMRWDVLARFAHITKSRLQDIRNISKESTLRKANVKKSHVDALLNHRTDLSNSFVNEMKHILAKLPLFDIYVKTYNSKPFTPSEIWQRIYHESSKVYTDLYKDQRKDIKLSQETKFEDLDKDFRISHELIMKINNKSGTLIKKLRSIGSVKYFKLYGNFRHCLELKQTLYNDFVIIQGLDKTAASDATALLFPGKNLSIDEYILQVQLRLEGAYTYARNSISMRIHEKETEAVKAASESFIKDLTQEILSLEKVLRK